jgi:hypothetical protein
MKLPHHENAVVASEKLTHYLLSPSHPVGQSKARFFRAHGFTGENWAVLEAGLLALARSEEVAETEVTPHGTKYVLIGSVPAPAGGGVLLRTVWIIDQGQDVPRFVTAYPA